MAKMNIKSGDEVVVISGKDKGKKVRLSRFYRRKVKPSLKVLQ